ncbi:MAG: hypothetical protein WBG18_20195, partial [Xanthobacteraceae bacterium]
VSAILSSRAKIKLKIQWYMCSQFYSDWRAIFIYQICSLRRGPVRGARLSPEATMAARSDIARSARVVRRLAPANCHDSLFYRSMP